jgi:hypothetical protein
MKKFYATVTYRTRRGRLGRWDGPIDANDLDEAMKKARTKVASRIGVARFDMIRVLTAWTHHLA